MTPNTPSKKRKLKSHNQSSKPLQLHWLMVRLTSLVPPSSNQCRNLTNHCLPHSPSVMWIRSRPLQVTSHHQMKTLLREDMLEFSSHLLPSKRLFSSSMKMLSTFTPCTRTPNHSRCSLRTQVLEPRKLSSSTKPYKVLVHSTHLLWSSSKSWLKTRDLSTSREFVRDTLISTNNLTRRRRSPSSQLLLLTHLRRLKFLLLSSLTQSTRVSNSSSSSRSMNPSREVFRCTPRPNSWTWVSHQDSTILSPLSQSSSIEWIYLILRQTIN